MKALSQREIEAGLVTLNAGKRTSWGYIEMKLHKKFEFSNFIEAFGFMSQVALIAEKANHHPAWFNVYKTVVVDLSTHDVSGVSEADFALASAMDAVADRFG